ncbi:hypothetical protein OG21DRAFT_1511647 [Imleria badia]|nr:hypothetical protein OG21DRAFT_1511647 [Imleria badia]
MQDIYVFTHRLEKTEGKTMYDSRKTVSIIEASHRNQVVKRVMKHMNFSLFAASPLFLILTDGNSTSLSINL